MGAILIGKGAQTIELVTTVRHVGPNSTSRQIVRAVAGVDDAGVEALIVTEIGRDGTLEGPDLDGLGEVLEATELPVIASGGVGSLADIVALNALRSAGRRLSGAIVGRALYEGAFTLSDALKSVSTKP